MWVKILPSDPTKEVEFKELPDDQTKFVHEASRIVHGYLERVYTQALLNAFPSSPRVVMLLNEDGQVQKLPINEKASKYYPNDYGIKVRGEAILVGEIDTWTDPEGPDRKFVDIPIKWRIINAMEKLLENADELGHLTTHAALDALVLQLVDPDVKKMYLEAQEQLKGWWTV